ncbi:unnamed protein product [Closterium sp. Naga37s-1]|nr:unnamed protein product [Closterium sp. Naga37s-1]
MGRYDLEEAREGSFGEHGAQAHGQGDVAEEKRVVVRRQHTLQRGGEREEGGGGDLGEWGMAQRRMGRGMRPKRNASSYVANTPCSGRRGSGNAGERRGGGEKREAEGGIGIKVAGNQGSHVRSVGEERAGGRTEEWEWLEERHASTMRQQQFPLRAPPPSLPLLEPLRRATNNLRPSPATLPYYPRPSPSSGPCGHQLASARAWRAPWTAFAAAGHSAPATWGKNGMER